MFGLWQLRAAFEEEHGQAESPATAVQHAALWVLYAGEVLRSMSAEGCVMPQNTGACGGKYRDRGWKGFTEDRWETWREELKKAGERLAGDELVQAAVEKMEKL